MKISRNINYSLFLIIISGDLAGRLLKYGILDYIFKPLLLLWLMLFFITSTKTVKISWKKWLVFALFFSWLGDIILMFADFQTIFFILGLLSFLTAHIFYAITFHYTTKNSPEKSILRKNPLLIFPFLLIAFGFYWIVKDSLGDLQIPVIIYVIVIMTMLLFALNRYQKVQKRSFIWVFLGGICFMISDFILGINKFVFESKLYLAGVWIMTTYILAQWLIVEGVIMQVKTKKY